MGAALQADGETRSEWPIREADIIDAFWHVRFVPIKLLIALWRLMREGIVPDGVVLRPAQ